MRAYVLSEILLERLGERFSETLGVRLCERL